MDLIGNRTLRSVLRERVAQQPEKSLFSLRIVTEFNGWDSTNKSSFWNTEKYEYW